MLPSSELLPLSDCFAGGQRTNHIPYAVAEDRLCRLRRVFLPDSGVGSPLGELLGVDPDHWGNIVVVVDILLALVGETCPLGVEEVLPLCETTSTSNSS